MYCPKNVHKFWWLHAFVCFWQEVIWYPHLLRAAIYLICSCTSNLPHSDGNHPVFWQFTYLYFIVCMGYWSRGQGVIKRADRRVWSRPVPETGNQLAAPRTFPQEHTVHHRVNLIPFLHTPSSTGPPPPPLHLPQGQRGSMPVIQDHRFQPRCAAFVPSSYMLSVLTYYPSLCLPHRSPFPLFLHARGPNRNSLSVFYLLSGW